MSATQHKVISANTYISNTTTHIWNFLQQKYNMYLKHYPVWFTNSEVNTASKDLPILTQQLLNTTNDQLCQGSVLAVAQHP